MSERYHGMPSSVIRGFDYAPERRELVIEFVSGRRYLYRDVPEEEAKGMRSAISKGTYFNRRIRDRYDCRELALAGNGDSRGARKGSGSRNRYREASFVTLREQANRE